MQVTSRVRGGGKHKDKKIEAEKKHVASRKRSVEESESEKSPTMQENARHLTWVESEMASFQPRRIRPFEVFHQFLPSWVSQASASAVSHDGPGPVHPMATPSHGPAKKHEHVDSEEVCGQFVQFLYRSQ